MVNGSPLSQRLLARLTFGQVFYWIRPEDIINKCGEIEVVDQSAQEGVALRGLAMGLESGPSGQPVALSRPRTHFFCTMVFIPYRVHGRTFFAPSLPHGGGFIAAEISSQRHNKMFVQKGTGNIAPINTQRLSEGVNHG